MSRLCYVEFGGVICLDGRRYTAQELYPFSGGYVRAFVEPSIGGESALCFGLDDKYVCCAAPQSAVDAMNTAARAWLRRHESQLLSQAAMAYCAVVWAAILATAFGLTDWSWTAALAPVWVPLVVGTAALLLVDLYRDVARMVDAARLFWRRVTRHNRRGDA